MNENEQSCIECGRNAVIGMGDQAIRLGKITAIDLAEFRGPVVQKQKQNPDGSFTYEYASDSAEAIIKITCDVSSVDHFITAAAAADAAAVNLWSYSHAVDAATDTPVIKPDKRRNGETI